MNTSIFKRILVLFLAVLMAFTSILPAFAKTEPEISAESTSGFAGRNAFDVIANNLSSGNDNENYAISYLELRDSIAYVDIGNADVCDVVIAIYDEDTSQMITSGTAQVPMEHQAVEVEIAEAKLPEYYVVKAFLLDGNHNALCEEYTCLMYTRAYEKFMERTPEDFKNDTVIVFENDEEKEHADFAVLTDDAVVEENASGMTFIYDESTSAYTFTNATKEVKKLNKGDVYFYQYGEKSNEFLLFKVKSVKISGSAVTVVQDTDIGLADVFQFVRIDAEGDYDEIELDEENLGEALTVVKEKNAIRKAIRKADPEYHIEDTNSWSTTFKLKWSLGKSKEDEGGGSPFSASISGTLGYELSTKITLLYDVVWFGKDYYEFKAELTHKFSLKGFKIEGKISLPDSVAKIPVPDVPVGPFTLSLSISPIVELSASISFTVSYTIKKTVTADNTNGLQKTSESESEWKVEIDDKIEIKVGFKLEVELTFCEVVSLTLSGSAGLKYSGNPSTISAWTDQHHDCIACIHGDVNLFIELGLSLKIKIIPKVLEFSWEMINWSNEWYLFDFYISLSKDGFSCGKGECNRISYAVTFEVEKQEQQGSVIKNVPLANVTVSSATGVCDADGDKKYDDASIKTDKDGKAVFYFRPGTHTVTASLDGYKDETVTVNISSQKKSEYITMHKKDKTDSDDNTDPGDITDPQDSDTETIVESGSCGDNVTYTLSDSGVLTISGSGNMRNYPAYDSPWQQKENSIKRIIIKEGPTSIGEHAFSGCNYLTDVTIPNSVVSIKARAFMGCNSLASITIPDSVTSIGDNAFIHTPWYDNQPDGLVYAGKVAYKYKGLMQDNTNLVLEDGTKGIAGSAFYNNKTLASITIPNSVMSVGEEAFKYCSSLTSVKTPESVTSIMYSIFENGSKQTPPDSSLSIGYAAFGYCSSLASVTIPNSVKIIGDYAFEDCYGLTSVTIPNSVTSIGDSAFSECYELTNVTIPNSVISIGAWAFESCRNLTNVTIPDSVVNIGEKGTFSGCHSLAKITIGNNVTCIGDWAFRGCGNLTDVTIGNSVTSIGEDAFWNCRSMTNVTIPNSVTSIGDSAFGFCSNITKVTIGNNVTSVGDSAFYSCSSLTDVTIPNSVISIGDSAFEFCSNMTEVTIGNSVTSIGFGAFSGCPIKNTYYTGTSEQWQIININNDNDALKGNVIYNYTPSSVKQSALAKASRFASFLRNAALSAQTANRTDTVNGEEYVLLVVKDANAENLLDADNLLYIDQQTADSEMVTFSYVPREDISGATATIYGANKESHIHKYTDLVTKAPTCAEPGESTYICLCGDGYTESIPATGKHTWNSGKVTTAATCKATGVKTFTCTVCSATKTEKIAKDANNHIGGTEVKNTVAATCGADGYTGDTYCKGCGEKLSTGTAIPATGKHTWNGGEITTAATCKATGDKTYTCSVCKTTKTEKIAATGHKLTKTAAKTATCTETGNVEYYTCSVCKKTFSDAKGTKEITDVTIKATGHSFGEWKVTKEATIKEEGTETRTCSKCGLEETRPIAKLEITYTLGDVDGDSNISAADARLALRRSVGLETYEEGSPEFLACDVDLDGNVSAADARLILRASVGLEDPKTWVK